MRVLLLASAVGMLVTSAAPLHAAQSWTRVQWSSGARRGSYLEVGAEAPRGLVVLLGVPDSLPLADMLIGAGITVIRPEYRPGTLFLDRRSVRDIQEATLDAMGRHGIPDGAVVVGGLSLGGTGAVRYTQHCVVMSCGPAAPGAVFAVDAPLDMERLWRASNLIVRRAADEYNVDEARWLLELVTEALGGGPDASPAAYLARSPYSYFAPRGGNAMFLVDLPVRLYVEPDVGYWIRERRYDYYTINAFDAAGLINQLLLLGNPRAELITTSGRGFDTQGNRNPHSWSIVDERELATWIRMHLGVP